MVLDVTVIKNYLQSLQSDLCMQLAAEDGKGQFLIDDWKREAGGHGSTRVLSGGNVIEQGGVNFSHILGEALPSAGTDRLKDFVGSPFEAMGVSTVIHPLNPFVPTAHLNVRFFIVRPSHAPPLWWFGGGFDLTPYYVFEEDCKHWHTQALKACEPFGQEVYPRFKQWADDYFYLKHRQEARGVGGLFFDDLNEWPFEKCFAFMQSVANHFISAYGPIIAKRKNMPYTQRARDFQCYRRGRYAEFNLIWDRGTLFGLQFGGRSESILMSLPPVVHWKYNWQAEEQSAEAELQDYLKPRDWLQMSHLIF